MTIKGTEYAGVHVIHNGDAQAGFSALITYALNGVRRSERKNWLPVVDYSIEETPHFGDPERGENVWEYYFEPVAEISSAELRERMGAGDITEDHIQRFSDQDVIDLHIHDPDRITTFWSGEKPANPGAWLAKKRELGRAYVAKYVKPKPHIIEKLESCESSLIKLRPTFGVHIRGTDFYYATVVGTESYIRAIEEHAAQTGVDDYGIYLATDQAQFVDEFKAHFGTRVVTYDAIRSESDVAPFEMEGVSPYKKGEDVLIDILMLARCEFLFKGPSAVGEYALWFNPKLECVDFALTSDFVDSNPRFSMSAYDALNVARRGPVGVVLAATYRAFRRTLTRLRQQLRRAMK